MMGNIKFRFVLDGECSGLQPTAMMRIFTNEWNRDPYAMVDMSSFMNSCVGRRMKAYNVENRQMWSLPCQCDSFCASFSDCCPDVDALLTKHLYEKVEELAHHHNDNDNNEDEELQEVQSCQ